MSTKNNRIEFSNVLKTYLGTLCTHYYYQPPEGIKMEYPAVVYTRNYIKKVNADNNHYLQGTQYQVMVLDKDPDSEIVDKLSRFPNSHFVRHFATSGLNHDVFTIYFK